MRSLLNTLKKIFFWNYARNTWQWDALCVVILIFIFLTPKSWFDNSERAASPEHQNIVNLTVWLGPEVVVNESDKRQIANQIKAVTGREQVEVLAVRKVRFPDGTTRGFEVDIR